MLTWVGALCILGGGFLVRQRAVSVLRQEEAALEELIRALERLRQEIRMTRMPMPRILARLAQDCPYTGCLFAVAAETGGLGGDLVQAWEEAAITLPLSRGIRRRVRELAGCFHGDEEAIGRVIEFTCQDLSGELHRIRADRAEQEKRTTALCFSGAALLVILLI